MNGEDEIRIIEDKLKECDNDLYKLLKIALIELKFINRSLGKPIIERPTFRIKGAESIHNKILDKSLNNEDINLENFTTVMKDLLGIRVICRDLSSVKKLCNHLTSHPGDMKIYEEKKIMLNKSENGYRGIHLIFTAKEGILSNPELKGEIQLRTIAQHYWATFSHHDYKGYVITSEYEEKYMILLSDELYIIDKSIDNLRSDIETDSLQIDSKKLADLFKKYDINYKKRDISKFLAAMREHTSSRGIKRGWIAYDLARDMYGVKDALTNEKNLFGISLSGTEEWTSNLYKMVLNREASESEIAFCRTYAYYKGFYWPKRCIFEYILSLKKENWMNLLGDKNPQNLVILLEAYIYGSIKKYSYYYSSDIEDQKDSFFNNDEDSLLIDNRDIDRLSKIGLVIINLDKVVRTYPHKYDYSYKKDAYQIECTPKGRNVSLEIIGKVLQMHNDISLKSILDDLEAEDFPQENFPYENSKSWGFPQFSVTIGDSIKKEKGENLHFNMKDWWTDKPGYY